MLRKRGDATPLVSADSRKKRLGQREDRVAVPCAVFNEAIAKPRKREWGRKKRAKEDAATWGRKWTRNSMTLLKVCMDMYDREWCARVRLTVLMVGEPYTPMSPY